MKKKLLFFITSLAGGGAEKVLVNMVNNLNKDKYQITVMTLFDYGVNKQFLGEDIEYKYVFKKVFRGTVQLFKIFSPQFLYRIMIREQYDVIVSYFQGATTRIIAGCEQKNAKLVQWIHNEFHERDKIVACYRNEDECLQLQKKFDATVYVAKTVRDIYLNTFPEIGKKDYVLYNVVESEKIKKLAMEVVEEKDLYKHKVTLVSVGRLVAQKAYDRLINVVRHLKRDEIDVNLLLLGSGELESVLKKQVIELGLTDSVVFLGYKENPYKYVKNADLFVCSSLHEGFSTAITEALIVGTPVVTTDCSGMEELLGGCNEYGVIVENNEEALYKGVKELILNREKMEYYKKQAGIRGKLFKKEETEKKIEEFLDTL